MTSVMGIIDCLRSGQHFASRDERRLCSVCNQGEPTGGERYIAEFEADAVKLHGLELLGGLHGVKLEQYLTEHEGTLEVFLFATVRVTSDGEEEKRTLVIDDAPVCFNPTWDESTLVECIVRDFGIEEAEARARLQKCGLLPNAAGPGDTGESITQAPPTDPQPDVRHTVPPQVRWHIAYRCADRQVILDENDLLVAEAVVGAAELVAAAPELLDLVDDLLDDLQRDRRIPEALALVERLRGAM